MTKLTNMNLPRTQMSYCPVCKEWVPDKDKHNRKKHNGNK